VTGSVFADSVSIAGMTIAAQHFLVPISTEGMGSVAADGVLGLALPGLSHTGETVLDRLRERAHISTFCLFLTGTQEGSYLAFGRPSEAWFAEHPVVWAPVRGGLWWAIEGTMVVGGVGIVAGMLLVDSGTSYLAAPPAVFQALVNAMLPAEALARCEPQGPARVLVCPCDVAEVARSLDVWIGSSSFPLRPVDLLIPFAPGSCALQFMPTREGMPLILGDTFLRTVFAIFDTEGSRVGLARRRLSPGWPDLPDDGGGGFLRGLPPWLLRCLALASFSGAVAACLLDRELRTLPCSIVSVVWRRMRGRGEAQAREVPSHPELGSSAYLRLT